MGRRSRRRRGQLHHPSRGQRPDHHHGRAASGRRVLGGGMSSALKITFGEWLMRMSVAKVPAAARTLAVYASVLDITGNEELASVSGVTGRTFDKYKRDLLK